MINTKYETTDTDAYLKMPSLFRVFFIGIARENYFLIGVMELHVTSTLASLAH
jgi:hypothetical protein